MIWQPPYFFFGGCIPVAVYNFLFKLKSNVGSYNIIIVLSKICFKGVGKGEKRCFSKFHVCSDLRLLSDLTLPSLVDIAPVIPELYWIIHTNTYITTLFYIYI